MGDRRRIFLMQFSLQIDTYTFCSVPDTVFFFAFGYAICAEGFVGYLY